MGAPSQEEQQVKAFWDKTEAELGEEVIACTMGKGLSGWSADEPQRELWGLFFVTERALYFRHFPAQHWLSSMVAGSALSVKDEEIYVAIPIDRMRSVALQQHRSLLKRLLSGHPSEFAIEYREADGSLNTVRFFLEAKSDAFLNVIEGGRG